MEGPLDEPAESCQRLQEDASLPSQFQKECQSAHTLLTAWMQEVKDSGGTLSVNTVAWLGGHSVLIGASVREPENDGQVHVPNLYFSLMNGWCCRFTGLPVSAVGFLLFV